MNWLLLVVAIILIWRISVGAKRGMVKEIISFISLAVLCLAVALLGTILSQYLEKDITSMVVAIILLLLLCIAQRILGLVFFSAKLIAKLPVIHSFDKLLGAAFGILETVLFVWMAYTLINIFGMGMLGTMILGYVEEVPILSFLYKYNYLQHVVEAVVQSVNDAGILQ